MGKNVSTKAVTKQKQPYFKTRRAYSTEPQSASVNEGQIRGLIQGQECSLDYQFYFVASRPDPN